MADFDSDSLHRNDSETGVEVVGRKAWTAYIQPLIFYPFLLAGLYFLDLRSDVPREYLMYAAGFIFLLFIYRIAVIRSFKLTIDSDSVSWRQGIFPWAVSGDWVRWRDADCAAYYSNFLSWVTNSYTLVVENKYTDKGKFRPTQVWAGRKVAGQINAALDRHSK